jgi:ATP-dependent Clp protease ATP-binding subunit ClpA
VFERFTEGSRAILVDAQDVARELGSPYIGVGHILYGCAEGRTETAGKPLHECGITGGSVRRLLPHTDERPGEGPGAGEADPEALRAIGIDYDGVRTAVEQTFGSGALDAAPDRRTPTRTLRKPRFTPMAKRTLEHSLRVALELHHKSIQPGHILLAVLRLDSEFVSTVIGEADTTVAALSAAVLTGLTAGE